MRDNEAKLFWLIPMVCDSSIRSGIKAHTGGECRLIHAWKSCRVDTSCVM